MKDHIKLCPFCKIEMVLFVDFGDGMSTYDEYVIHPTTVYWDGREESCVFSTLKIPMEKWQTRPIEDELNMEIDELRTALYLCNETSGEI